MDRNVDKFEGWVHLLSLTPVLSSSYIYWIHSAAVADGTISYWLNLAALPISILELHWPHSQVKEEKEYRKQDACLLSFLSLKVSRDGVNAAGKIQAPDYGIGFHCRLLLERQSFKVSEERNDETYMMYRNDVNPWTFSPWILEHTHTAAAEAETKKDKILKSNKKNTHIYILLYIYISPKYSSNINSWRWDLRSKI